MTVGPGQTVTENAEYHTLGHLARFVKPGARRIASTSFGTTGWNGQIMDAAFRNRDGSTALVVHNENDDPRSFAVAQGGHSFDYTLPGGALATFTWPASRALDDDLELLDADRMSATASPVGEPGNAVDDDATTRWTSGTAQQPGQWVQVDLGRSQRVRRVVLDTGVDVGRLPARLRAVHEQGRLALERAGCHRRRPGPADHHRFCGDRSALPPRRPDRDRATVVVDRRPAGLPLRRRA